MKKIICLYGGPGTGKSTTCAGLFYKLKQQGYNSEMNREYIKEWVWEERSIKPGDQTYFFSKQSRKERIYMENEIDFIITDSPLILTHYYGIKYDKYEQKFNTSKTMLKHHHGICKDMGYTVDHFLLERVKKFEPKGRLQTEEECLSFDKEIRSLLEDFSINYKSISADEGCVDNIIKYILEQKQ